MSIPLIAILAALLPDGGRGTPDLIDDPIVRSFCRVLAEKSLSDRTREHGAFAVRTAEGMFYFVVWPPSGEKDVLRWHGRFPSGTIAILHTHPAWQPAASELDMRTARRARIPVYVITIFSISKTTGEGSEVVREKWFQAEESGAQSPHELRIRSHYPRPADPQSRHPRLRAHRD